MSKIDVHHHVYPPEYTEALNQAGGDPSGWYIPLWTLSADHNIKTRTGTKTAVLSITAPGPAIVGNATAAAALARKCNEYCAHIRDEDPHGYGFFACLPSLLDTSATLAEIAYAFDILHADGVIVYTRYGAGHTYLGDEQLVPVWAELDRRAAVVLVHPTHQVDTALVNAHAPQPLFDYPHETGRAAIDLILQGRTQQFPSVKIILSHAGGTLPALVGRVAGLLPSTPMSVGMSGEEIHREARRFYFDTALSSYGTTMKMLLEFAEKGHVLFGSDFPNAPESSIEYFTRQLEGLDMDGEAKEDIYFGTAKKLFPRLGGEGK